MDSRANQEVRAQVSPFAYVKSVVGNNELDPIRYYQHPIFGKLFRGRIEMGLKLLGRNYERLLEVGYGSGFLLPHLKTRAKEVYGLDLDSLPDKINPMLKECSGMDFHLQQGSVLQVPYPDQHFDCVVAFSILEHISEINRAVDELHRILKPGGHLLVGMPAVNRAMNSSFKIFFGHKTIDEHHVTTPADFSRSAQRKFKLANRESFPRLVPNAIGLYHAFLLVRV